MGVMVTAWQRMRHPCAQRMRAMQLEADTRETANDGPGHIHSGEDDNLFHRLKAVCTTVLHQHVQRAIEDGDPAAAVVGFQQVLERLERFIALDDAQDSLSLHRLAGAGGDHDVRPAVHTTSARLRHLSVRSPWSHRHPACQSVSIRTALEQ